MRAGCEHPTLVHQRLDALKKLAKYTNDRRVLETLVKTVKDGKDDAMKIEAAKLVARDHLYPDPSVLVVEGGQLRVALSPMSSAVFTAR